MPATRDASIFIRKFPSLLSLTHREHCCSSKESLSLNRDHIKWQIRKVVHRCQCLESKSFSCNKNRVMHFLLARRTRAQHDMINDLREKGNALGNANAKGRAGNKIRVKHQPRENAINQYKLKSRHDRPNDYNNEFVRFSSLVCFRAVYS